MLASMSEWVRKMTASGGAPGRAGFTAVHRRTPRSPPPGTNSSTLSRIIVMSSCCGAPARNASISRRIRSRSSSTGKWPCSLTSSARRASPNMSPSGFIASLIPSVKSTMASPRSSGIVSSTSIFSNISPWSMRRPRTRPSGVWMSTGLPPESARLWIRGVWPARA